MVLFELPEGAKQPITPAGCCSTHWLEMSEALLCALSYIPSWNQVQAIKLCHELAPEGHTLPSPPSAVPVFATFSQKLGEMK